MATAAVAILIRKEKQIVEAFRDAGATSPDKSVTMASIGMHERFAFRKLKQHAVLRETAPDHFYLDEPSWDAMRHLRHQLAAVLIVVVVIMMLFSMYMTLRAQ